MQRSDTILTPLLHVCGQTSPAGTTVATGLYATDTDLFDNNIVAYSVGDGPYSVGLKNYFHD